MKQVWADSRSRNWADPEQGGGRTYLRQATQVKNIWIPYGA
jgi:aldehyde dehydrogenase (NAD+)